MSAVPTNDRDLLELAHTSEERAFAVDALQFLARHATRRTDATVRWGVGEEQLALFHESSGEAELAEAEAARAWQARRWEAGFGWITGPVRHGGRGLTDTFDSLYRMLEAAFDIVDMNPLRIGLGTVQSCLRHHGNDDQLAEFAVPLMRGDTIACQLFSEPGAGSDLAGVRTRATRTDGGWRVDGQKVWTSNGNFADIGLALVRTDPDVAKHRGLTMMIVPMDTPGVEVRKLRQMTGGASFCEVFLDAVFVPDRLCIGEPGTGWSVTTNTLAHERRVTGDRSHELVARATELLWLLACRVHRDADPLVRDAWARVYTGVRAARFQQQRMQETPAEDLTGSERAMDKLLLVNNLRAIGDLARELLGASFVADTGAWGTYNWNKWLMGALGYRIAGGTDEVVRNLLGEQVLGLPREPKPRTT
ncbi:acyl-CoA dehydrogenase family protein [uncultured Jatrophihabitans sp.]|uniref:acyl-CoA dehydrogenase family protein n=1 Tax=uncultured Jatrophihabitans sp. TaxID=1610747 RepID=UPI0035C96159